MGDKAETARYAPSAGCAGTEEVSVKRFVVEIEEHAWKKIVARENKFYKLSDPGSIPPSDKHLFYNYLARRTGACWHDDDELHYIRITED